MSTALIINAGDYSPLPDNIKYDFVIACDAGYENAKKLGITPDLIIGDFDSYKGDPETDFGDIQVSKYNVMKDDTDCMLAIKRAILLGHTHIILACSLGGRMDHTIANIQSMAYVVSRGLECEIITSQEYMKVITDSTITIPKEEGYSLSLFSLSDTCTGLTISGSLYDVSNITLENSFPLGLGNTWVKNRITVSVKKGQLLIIKSKIND